MDLLRTNISYCGQAKTTSSINRNLPPGTVRLYPIQSQGFRKLVALVLFGSAVETCKARFHGALLRKAGRPKVISVSTASDRLNVFRGKSLNLHLAVTCPGEELPGNSLSYTCHCLRNYVKPLCLITKNSGLLSNVF
jgi:hypothetical protein